MFIGVLRNCDDQAFIIFLKNQIYILWVSSNIRSLSSAESYCLWKRALLSFFAPYFMMIFENEFSGSAIKQINALLMSVPAIA